MHRWMLCFALTLAMALTALPARAYLDPASGSMILQLILGGVAGLAVVVKLFWHKILGLLGVKGKEHDDPAA